MSAGALINKAIRNAQIRKAREEAEIKAKEEIQRRIAILERKCRRSFEDVKEIIKQKLIRKNKTTDFIIDANVEKAMELLAEC